MTTRAPSPRGRRERPPRVERTGLDRTRPIPVGTPVWYGDEPGVVVALDLDPGYVRVRFDRDGVVRTRSKSRLRTNAERDDAIARSRRAEIKASADDG